MFVVFDLETTGLSEATCDVIEFSYIMFDDNNNYVKSEQLYFYYKGMSWSEDAFKVHQIPLEFLEQYEDKFRENIIKMYTVLNHSNVVGHNAVNFDCPFAKTWLLRQGLRNLEYGVIQDTMVAYKPITKKRMSLTKLSNLRGITPDGVKMLSEVWFPNADVTRPHQASYDVVATALLTLQGLNENLIRFTPLFEADTSLNNDDTSSMYELSSNVLDPNRFIVELKDDEDSESVYHFINHNYSEYSDRDVTAGDIESFESNNRLFPIAFYKSSNNKYSAKYNGVEYELVVDKNSRDVFTIITEFGNFNEVDMDIESIIRENFKDINK